MRLLAFIALKKGRVISGELQSSDPYGKSDSRH